MSDISVMHGRSELLAHDVILMQELRNGGMVAEEIAEKFECSKQQVLIHTKSVKSQHRSAETITRLRDIYQRDKLELHEPTVILLKNKPVGVFIPTENLSDELIEMLGIKRTGLTQG